MSSEPDVLEQEFDMLIVVLQVSALKVMATNDASDEHLKCE
jgi:hypothetical protein